VAKTFPAADAMGPGYEQWTWDAFLAAARKCFEAGVPFGLPISNCTDANAWLATLFASFGAQFVDAKGDITVRSDAMREALDYLKRLGPFLPADTYTWNNGSNNRVLISGKSAMIINPPSAWASAVKENPPVGAQIWHHPLPAQPGSRFLPWQPNFLAVWNFSPAKSAAKELIGWLGEREQVKASLIASHGYDIPAFVGLTDFPVWAEAGPPEGTLFNYPMRAAHHSAAIVPGQPAPPMIAAGISGNWVLPKLAGRVTQGRMATEAAIIETERDLAGIIAR
jgi:ABC-type glycerol-3-phosphate transport system substrate-binding protein